MRIIKSAIYRIAAAMVLLAAAFTVNAQKLTVESFEANPFDLTAVTKPVLDLNNNPCGLVKVRLAVAGAKFGGNIIEPVEYDLGEYNVYMTEGSHLMIVRGPGFVPLSLDFRDYGIHHVQAKCTYILTLLLPTGTAAPVDDGLRYLVITVNPANAMVFVDDKQQAVQNGSASVLVPQGTHTYRVEATGYLPKSGSVEIADGRKTVNVSLESAMAQITVNCPTTGAQIYVNEQLKGTAPWSGQLMAGNYQIEARLDGYRMQRQSIAVAERETRTIDIPALTAIVGALNVNYQPINSEVWLDGSKLGVEPDIFRNLLVGDHSVEIRAEGYQTDKKTVTIREGETAQLSGTLAVSNAITYQSNATASSSNATVSVPDAIDLGLSVKWASFNLGASKPEEAGYYYKWGETTPADDKGWETYKYANGNNRTLTKYCSDSKYGDNGFTDEKVQLEPIDDAVIVNLGESWRMPTIDEIYELIRKCKWKWTKYHGIRGYRVTGPNGRYIFLPVTSWKDDRDGSIANVNYGEYWSSSVGGNNSGNLGFYSEQKSYYASNRAYGFAIRPVLAE